MYTDEIGLRFCGMVEEEPRLGTKGSLASLTSVCIISLRSVRELAQCAGQEAEETARLGDAVPFGVPSDVRLRQAKFVGQGDLHLQALVTERGQRAAGAAELEHLHAGTYLRQPLLVALQGGQQAGHLEAEGDRNCLLQVAAARHRRVAVIPLPASPVAAIAASSFDQ